MNDLFPESAQATHKFVNILRDFQTASTVFPKSYGQILQVVKELPFVVGVMGDFSGDPTSKLKPLKDRKFIQVDRDNFNDVLQRMTPGLNMRVENTLAGDGSEMSVNLEFESMDDFEPAKIVDKVEPLKKLMETRDKLRDLATKIDRSDDLENVLEQVLSNSDQLKKLSGELGVETEE